MKSAATYQSTEGNREQNREAGNKMPGTVDGRRRGSTDIPKYLKYIILCVLRRSTIRSRTQEVVCTKREIGTTGEKNNKQLRPKNRISGIAGACARHEGSRIERNTKRRIGGTKA